MVDNTATLPQLGSLSIYDGRPAKSRAKTSAPDLIAQMRANGTLRTRGRNVDIGGGLPVSADDPFGLGALGGITAGYQQPTPQPAVNPLQAQIDTANTDIGNRRLELASSDDPYAEAGLKNKAQQATTLAEAVAMASNPPPQHQFAPIQPGAYPRMGAVAMPDRPSPHVNPLVAALAAFGGAFSPSAASHFGVSAIQGANDEADKQYQYDLNERRMKLQELSQAHDDEIAAHNEALKYAEANLRGKERTDYLNALGRYDYQTVLDKLKAQGAGQDVLDKGYGDLTGSARAREKLTAMLTNQLETRNQLIGQLQAQQAGNLEQAKLQGAENVARIRAETPIKVQYLRNQGAKEKEGGFITQDADGNPLWIPGTNTNQASATTERWNAAQLRATTALQVADKRLAAAKSRQLADPTTNLQFRGLQEQLRTERNALHDMVSRRNGLEKLFSQYGQPNAKQQAQLGQMEAGIQAQMQRVNGMSDQVGKFAASVKTTAEPPRGPDVPKNYIFKENGPKGTGWYKP